MMKILHVITGLNTGGAETFLYRLLSEMDREKFQPSVISLLDEGTLGEPIKALGIPIYTLNMKSPLSAPITLLKLMKLTRYLQPDIIQGWMYHGNIAAMAGTWLMTKHPKVLWNIRQALYDLDLEKNTTASIIRLGAKWSHKPHHIIYNTETGAGHHEAIGYDRAKREIIPNGFDTEKFKPSDQARHDIRVELSLPESTLLIGLIGRFHPMKDHANFIEAAKQLSKDFNNIHFLLAGREVDIKNKTLTDQIQATGLSNQFHLLGERKDMPTLMAALDIATSASYTEGFPNVIGEAMACGVPCVVTDVGDSASLVADTGVIVPPQNPNALSQAWRQLIEVDDDQRQKLGQNARQRIKTFFQLEKIVNDYEILYNSIDFHEN